MASECGVVSCEWGWMGMASECGVVRVEGCGQCM